MRSRTWWLALALAAFAAPAGAQEKPGEKAGEKAGRRRVGPEDRPAMLKIVGSGSDHEENRGTFRDVRPPAKGVDPAAERPRRPGRGRPLAVSIERLREARKDVVKARKEARGHLKRRLAVRLAKAVVGAVPPAALRQELERHARRIARLTRIGELAAEAADEASAALVEELVEKEDARHERWMSKRLGADGGEAPGDPPAPAADPGGAP